MKAAGRRAVGRLALAKSLPRLAWQAVRWRPLSGGWLVNHLKHHRPFDINSFDAGVPIDVIVTLVDHFEPTSRLGHDGASEQIRSWCEAHRAVAGRHRDADGRPPQHTWFYRSEYRNFACLQEISESTFRGFGEVEFHLHHGFDTHESFTEKLRTGLDWFNQGGAMVTAEPVPRRVFGYIAGNWSLDNGTRDSSKSGCNTELTALRDAGCYADFTFPALGSSAQPRLSNTLYYATDDPRPKSYDQGVPLARGRVPSGDLMIFQGPLAIDWARGRFEGAALESFAPPSADRMDSWLRANVHVEGRPEWIFIKLHTHGVQSREVLFPSHLDALFDAMTRTWNRAPFRLHFATAREAYNIAKAAEAGRDGNPNEYRDFVVPRPANRMLTCDVPWRLLSWDPPRVSVEIIQPSPVEIKLGQWRVKLAGGQVRRVSLSIEPDHVEITELDSERSIDVQVTRSKAGSLR
jgi:hypothetical protein